MAVNERRSLLAILILALALRLWGIQSGLPGLYHPDEPNKVAIAQRMIRTGDLNPHYFDKGTLLIYVNAAAQYAYYAWGKLGGSFASFDDLRPPEILIYGTGFTKSPGTFVAGRSITVAVGVASVWLLFLCASAASGNPRTALLAALLMAVAPIPVAHSRYITVNMFVVFFCLLATWASLKILRESGFRYYLLGGLAAGFAAGSKYPAALVTISPVVAHFLRYGFKAAWTRRSVYLVPVFAGLGFLATTPYAVLAYDEFLRDVLYQARHYGSQHFGMEGNALAFYLKLLWNTDGALVCILALASLPVVIRSNGKTALVLASFALVYFVSIASLPVRNARTFLPVLPFVYLFFAIGASDLWQRAERLERGRAPTLSLVLVLVVAGLSVPAYHTAQEALRPNQLLARENSRRWIAQNIPAGSRVALEAYSPFVDPQRYEVRAVPLLIQIPLQSYRRNFDYVIAAQRSYGRFFHHPERYHDQMQSYRNLFASLEPVKTFADGNEVIRIFRSTRSKARRPGPASR
ncbi:MAG: glycosyltransferase family 39 protein [Candidatus Krumholzibacteriia bacterium]